MAVGDQRNIDRILSDTNKSIRQSLVNTPADPFLWLVLFWLENTQNGFSRSNFRYLRQSYSLGPNEGWIAVKRVRFALAVFPVLPPDLADSALNDFTQLVKSHFIWESAQILGGPGWPVREFLLSRLTGVAEADRQALAKILYDLGYDVTVPGVDRPDWRPWH
jgi:hypothetical protein